MKWLPISTAPKDGTKILVTDANTIGCEECVFWDDDPQASQNSIGWQWATDDGPSYHEERFTHWMPLPEPPND